MRRTSATVGLVALLGACNIIDDEPPETTGGTTDGSADAQACVESWDSLLTAGCPAGYVPHIVYDGGSSTVVRLDDPAAAASLGLILFESGVGADYVGIEVFQNTACTLGCFAPPCQSGQHGCYGNRADGSLCGHYCTDNLDEMVCTEFMLECGNQDPGATTGDTGEDTSEGLDETGGESQGAAPDCSEWNERPKGIITETGPVLNQDAFAEIVSNYGAPLIECEGVRVRRDANGGWTVSKMREGGFMSLLDLRVGDTIKGFNQYTLDSSDALMNALAFLQNDQTVTQDMVLHVQREDVNIDIHVEFDG